MTAGRRRDMERRIHGYLKKDGKVVGNSKNKTSIPVQALSALWLYRKNNIFETDLFAPIILAIRAQSKIDNAQARRIADHLRTSIFLLAME